MDQRRTHNVKLRASLWISLAIAVAAVAITKNSKYSPSDVFDYVQCQVCHTPGLTGSVQDSCCDYETVDTASSSYFHPILHELTTLSFFRYFKVNLFKKCPYWQEDAICAIRECAVCECPEEEIPKKWYEMDMMKKMMKKHSSKPKSPLISKEYKNMKECPDQRGEGQLGRVDRHNTEVGKEWSEENLLDIWIEQDDTEKDMQYINLLDNPERYTGYGGLSAERIWNAIYKENCFEPPEGSLDGMCFEERVYYRLISGMQASINTHIAQEYKFRSGWGVNTKLYVDRVGKYPERLENLYFTYLFVLRAVGRAKNILLNYDYSTGNEVDDERTRQLIKKLVDADGTPACTSEGRAVLKGFDESALFSVPTKGLSYVGIESEREKKMQLKKQFREKFQNISRIMDCVGCEKCRLWGKIQVMGIGTAIKILLADDIDTSEPFQRNEIIALINVLTRLSESVDGVRIFRDLEFQEVIHQFMLLVCGLFGFVLLVWFVRKLRQQRRLAWKLKCKTA